MIHLPRFIRRVLIPFLLATLLIGILLYQEHKTQEKAIRQRTEINALQITNLISDRIEIAKMAMVSTDSFFSSRESVNQDEFYSYIDNLYEHLPELVLIQYVDPENVGSYIYPYEEENLSRVGMDYSSHPEVQELIDRTKTVGRGTISRPYPMNQGYPGIILIEPIFRDNTYIGAVMGELRLSEMTKMALDMAKRLGVTVMIRVDDSLIDLEANAIRTATEELLIEHGKSIPDPDAPSIYSFGNRIENRFPVVDSEWSILVEDIPRGLLEINSFSVLLCCIFLLIFLVLLAALDREIERQQKVSARERDFLSLVSHQLRLPLTQLNWSTELLTDRNDLPEGARILIDENHRISVGASRLVSNLLNVSRIERGVLKLELETVKLNNLISDTLMTLRQSADEAGLEIKVGEIHDVMVKIDHQKAIEAIRNVIDNAIKYGKGGKTIEIDSILSGSGYVMVSIKDHGPGIPSEKNGSIFDKTSAYSKKEIGTGSGLGLYLTKQFLEIMGGKVSYESKPGDTTFKIYLPLAK